MQIQRVVNTQTVPYSTNWSAASKVNDQAQVVDGKWAVDGNTIRPVETGYDRLVAIGDVSWHDYDVTVPFTVHGLGPGHNSSSTSGAALIGLGLNWRGHQPKASEQPGYYWYPTGAFTWYRWTTGPKF